MIFIYNNFSSGKLELDMDKELDLRGLQCPEPVIRCRSLLAESRPVRLKALVDNAAALENVSRYLERNGYAASQNRLGESEWLVEAVLEGAAPEIASAPRRETSGDKTLVLLTAETIGAGDDGLGAKLMNNFLASLPEMGPSLWRIILLNGAVRLSALEGPALESLKALEAAGVSVLVCGTCLTHYGLLDKKRVGETTNMMDVVTSLAFAQKVIRP